MKLIKKNLIFGKTLISLNNEKIRSFVKKNKIR